MADPGSGDPADAPASIVLDPDRAIIDAHHHLFVRPALHYLADDYRADITGGHRIVASVFVEAGAFPRPDGPEALRPLGEVEFANGMAAMARADYFGGAQACAGIVGHADLTLGDSVAELLDRCLAAAPERFRGIRQLVIDPPSESAFRYISQRPRKGLLTSTAFHEGFSQLAPRRLSFDVGVFHNQFPDVAALADQFPDTTLILNHLGMVLGLDHDEAGRAELRADWARGIAELARRPNIVCKLGGMGMPVWGFGFEQRRAEVGEDDLAACWKPYVETAIAAFGAERCMFESNFPIDRASCDYVTLWNVFKRIAAGCSEDEKEALFSGTAARVYRLDLAAALAARPA